MNDASAAVDSAIVYRNPRDLIADENNSRTHSDAQIEIIRGLIREFKFTNPVLLKGDGVTIGAGHGRTRAAILEGLPRIPTITLAHLSDVQWRAYAIADNQSALDAAGAGWDNAVLAREIEALRNLDFKVDVIGFDSVSLDSILAGLGPLPNGSKAPIKPGLTDPDEALEPPAVPVTREGDVWLMGAHRLVCGDSTKAADVAKALSGARPNLMVTDPPYGVSYDPKWRDDLGIDWTGQTQRTSTHPKAKPIKSRSLGKVDNDDRADWSAAWCLFPGDVAYVWHGGLHAGVVQASLASVGLTVRTQVIWVKQHFVFSRGDYHWRHEPCWYAVRKGRPGAWAGDRKQTTVWEIANASAFRGENDDQATDHGTQKPVECMKRPIENNSEQGDSVYDPFLGSGTTLIAAEMTGRICLGLELSPAYCDVIVSRWQSYIGQEARLEATGETFAEAKTSRLSKPAKGSLGSNTSATKSAPHAKRKAGVTPPTSRTATGTIAS